tara:strand:+ start:816 stop:1019 length:204 start_codon:yes stop_codon:yes gene_type:complete
MSGREKLVNWIKFYSQFKPFTPKQIDREEERLRKIKEDFEEVWGDDLDWLDKIDYSAQTDDDLRKEK